MSARRRVRELEAEVAQLRAELREARDIADAAVQSREIAERQQQSAAEMAVAALQQVRHLEQVLDEATGMDAAEAAGRGWQERRADRPLRALAPEAAS